MYEDEKLRPGAIAKALGVGRATVIRWRDEEGWAHLPWVYPKKFRLRVVRYAHKVKSCRKAGTKYGVHFRTVIRWMKEIGVSSEAMAPPRRWRCECSPMATQLKETCVFCQRASPYS